MWSIHFLSNYKFKVFNVLCWIAYMLTNLSDVNRNIHSCCIWALCNHKQLLYFRINVLLCKKLPEFELRADNHVTTPNKISADGLRHMCHYCIHRADMLQLKLGGVCKDISRRSSKPVSQGLFRCCIGAHDPLFNTVHHKAKHLCCGALHSRSIPPLYGIRVLGNIPNGITMSSKT